MVLYLNGAIAKKRQGVSALFRHADMDFGVFGVYVLDSSTSLILICVLAVLIAFGASAGNLSTWSMITDIYDVDEIMTRQRRRNL